MKNVIHQMDSKNEWLLLSVSFTAKFVLFFVLTIENAFSERLHFKVNGKSIGSSKKRYYKFSKKPPRLRDRHDFMWQWVEILNVFNTLTLKQIFWKMKSFFKNLEYYFLVESTKIKSASFPYKTAIFEANVKTNWMGSTKNGILLVTTSFFWRFCFSLRTPYKELIWCTIDPNAHTRTFCKRWSFIWRCFFPVSILKCHIGLSYCHRLQVWYVLISMENNTMFPYLQQTPSFPCKNTQNPAKLQ